MGSGVSGVSGGGASEEEEEEWEEDPSLHLATRPLLSDTSSRRSSASHTVCVRVCVCDSTLVTHTHTQL